MQKKEKTVIGRPRSYAATNPWKEGLKPEWQATCSPRSTRTPACSRDAWFHQDLLEQIWDSSCI
jgi:hypothetical protein